MKTGCLGALFILSVFLFIFSCRTTIENDELHNEYISSGNPVPIEINFLGTEWKNENIKDIGNYSSLVVNNNNQNYAYNIDNFTFTEVKKILDKSKNNEYFSSLGLANEAKTGILEDGIKYKILAYKKNGNSYIFHKSCDFTAGNNSKIILDAEQNYTFLIFSMETKELPEIVNENDFENVHFSLDKSDLNSQILYQRIDDFVPNGYINDTLPVKLKHVNSNIRLILDSSKLIRDNEGKKIISISNSWITYNRPKDVKLSDISSSTNLEEVKVPINNFRVTDGKGMVMVSEFISAFLIDPNENIKFHTDVKVEGITSHSKINNLLIGNIKQGWQQTFHLKQLVCGAYLGPNETNFRELMCHNLGDGYSGIWVDKFAGNRYAWGRKAIVSSDTKNDYEEENIWRNDENPCPDGYRVPTLEKWRAIFDEKNNKRQRIRDKNTGDIGWAIGGRLSLFYHDDYRRFLWTSTQIDPDQELSSWAWSIAVYDSKIEERHDNKTYGQAVRCIKK